MHTDSHFMIGYTHTTGGKTCQDYATSGRLSPTAAYAIVSDGCSTGTETDIGARLVSLATVEGLRRYHAEETRNPSTMRSAVTIHQDNVLKTSLPLLGCRDTDLLATNICAFYEPSGGYVYVQGDGVFAYITNDDRLHIHRIEWQSPNEQGEMKNTAPFYPAYRLDGCRNFLNYYGSDLSANVATWQVWHENVGNLEPRETQWSLDLKTAMNGVIMGLQPDLRFVAVFTDGVTQVDGVDWKETVRQLLAFKTTTGDFAKRRMMRFVLNTQRTGKGPLDDIGFAVIHNEEVKA